MTRRRVGFLVTCLVDFFRPEVALAGIRLLQAAECEVTVLERVTCCGQPAWNSGDRADARELAVAVLDACAGEELDAVVAPSGSCIGMLRQFPQVLGVEHPRHDEARALADAAFELSAYLTDVLGFQPGPAPDAGPVTYHDSCSGLRELGVRDQPRALLAAAGVDVEEMDAAAVCCGFGGTFCVKYPDISGGMVDDKIASIERTGAKIVVAGDLGCLLNIQGRLERLGKSVRAVHFAELLAADGDDA